MDTDQVEGPVSSEGASRRSWPPPRRLMIAYGSLVVAATAVYMTVPDALTPVWALIGLSGVVAMLVGTHVNRPAHRWPWWVLAAALFSFIAGDTYYNVVETYFHVENPFPSPPTPATSSPIRCSPSACPDWSTTAGPATTCPDWWTR